VKHTARGGAWNAPRQGRTNTLIRTEDLQQLGNTQLQKPVAQATDETCPEDKRPGTGEKLQGLPRETEPGNEGAGARMNTYTTLECLQRMTHAEPAGPLANLAEEMRGTLLRKRKQRLFWVTTQGHQRPLCLAKPSRLAQRHITQIPCATVERAKQQG
jgi:hypothetical protein